MITRVLASTILLELPNFLGLVFEMALLRYCLDITIEINIQNSCVVLVSLHDGVL